MARTTQSQSQVFARTDEELRAEAEELGIPVDGLKQIYAGREEYFRAWSKENPKLTEAIAKRTRI